MVRLDLGRSLLGLATLLAALAVACDGGGEGAGALVTGSPSPALSGGGTGAPSRPPQATATSGGTGVALGIGSYCWGSVCVDSVGVVVRPPALSVARGATVRVANPAPGVQIKDANVQAWPQTGQPLVSSGGEEAWQVQASKTALPATASPAAVEFAADLPPGRYIVAIFLAFDRGDVTYGLVLEVR